MNREIKFRAWDDSKMIYPTGALSKLKRFINIISEDAIIMQFTGLLDINGVEIYEGDILYVAGLGNCKVLFTHAAWAFENSNHLLFFNEVEFNDNVGEVIGNIYENSELVRSVEA